MSFHAKLSCILIKITIFVWYDIKYKKIKCKYEQFK